MQNECYPKSNYIIPICFSIVFSVMAIISFFVQTNDSLLIRFIFSGLMHFSSITMLIGGLYNMQYYEIIGNNIILRNGLGKMVEIDLNNAIYEVKNLITLSAHDFDKKNLIWICIYDKDHLKKFEYGFTNKKNEHRMQMIYSVDLVEELESRKIKSLSKFEFLMWLFQESLF